ncbi:MAG TPA: alpha/beta hydrolase [Solimonas sp.]|nr:alpha/beta hydrolase [Solimonas sp.]
MIALAPALDALLNQGRAPPTDAWPAGTRWVETRAGRLRVLDTGGAGPVVLMTPDGPNVIEHHLEVIDRLRPHGRIVCFDLPGFGYSRPGPRYGHRLEEGAAVVLSLMDALQIPEAALHFSCANGLYALAAAKAAPQRIRRLMLCQTPSLEAMRAWTHRTVPRPLQVPVAGQLLMRAARRRFAKIWYDIALPDPTLRPGFLAKADQALCSGGCYCLAGVVQGLLRARDGALDGVRQPVTLLWGGRDRSHRHTRAESLQDLVPQAQVHQFPESGHFPDLEHPQRYADLALAALDA